jgi:hypothetical protein
MSDEIVKQERRSAIEAFRALRTLNGDDQLSIAKTAVRDGTRGLVARGISFLQRLDEDRYWDALLDEMEEMRQAGQIRDDFDHTDAGVASVREFFEFIDGKPDEARFRAFCALFMSANATNANANEVFVDLELMSTLRKLSAGEMRVLSAFLKVGSYRFAKGLNVVETLAEAIGNTPQALISRNAEALLQQSLIMPGWSDTAGTTGNKKPLLTDLGLELLKRIEKYDAFKASQNAVSSSK